MDQLIMQEIVVSKTVNDIEMGVMKDGTPYLTGRSLAKLCGVAISTIINQKDQWESGSRSNAFARRLLSAGFSKPKLAVPIKTGASGIAAEALAYPEEVVMAFLDYFAFEQPRKEALSNYRVLAQAGFRLFVYSVTGYDPRSLVPEPWREFHDRLGMHSLPMGYFSVFKEMADFILLAIQKGFTVDHHNVPDISVGIRWSKYWKEKNLEETFGASLKYEHNYPDYFPQAKSNPQDMNVYPIKALGEFRAWLQDTYIPKHFPGYLESKVKNHALPASTAELLLAAIDAPKQLNS